MTLTNKNSRLALIGIVLVAALFRIPFLSTVPNGFFCDEAASGYDSYSLLKTQRDQYGEFLPLFPRSFAGSGHNESLYRFLTVPSISIFGLNEFAARLPAALVGILTVVVLFFLGKELFNEKVALISALFLAISPWHIQFSRITFRAILLPFFFCLGLVFFLKGLKKANYLYLSAISFVLSLYTYSSARVFVPLFLIGLAIIFFKELKEIKKQTFIAAATLLFLTVPAFLFWISPKGLARASAVLNISLITNVYHYVLYFSPNFLFLKGDPNIRHSLLNVGQLHLFEFVTVLVGVFSLLKLKRKEHKTLFLWLLLYPIPAALTEPGHALRSIVGAPVFSIFSAYGIFVMGSLFQARKRICFLVGASLIVIASVSVFIKDYFLEYPKYTTRAWQYGMREAITYAEKNSYDCVLVSDRFLLPHIFILFYTQYPPSEYQTSPMLSLRYTDYTLGKYHILSVSKQSEFKEGCLFIIKPGEIKEMSEKEDNLQVVHVVRDYYGNEVIKLITKRSVESK